jgi:uncharacterized protein DUF6545
MSVVVAVLIWLAAGYRLLLLLRHPNFLNTMYGLIFVFVASAFTVKVIEPQIDSVAGAYHGDLIKHLLVVAMGASIELYILAVDVGRPERRSVLIRMGVAAVVAVGMIAAFATAPIHMGAGGEDLDQAYVGVPQVMAYRLIFNAYLTFVLVENVRLYRRFGRAPGDEGRLTNLRLVAWGSAVGIVYSGTRVISILSVAMTGHPLTALETVGSAAALVGGVCVALAVFSPRFVPWFTDWRSARRGVRRLDALWSDLTVDCPGVVLSSGASRASRRAEFVFDRRLVETSECLRRVRLPESSKAVILGSPEPLAALATELRRGRPEWTSASGPSPANLQPPATSRAHEVTRLLELADAYTASARNLPAPESVRR